MSTLSSGSESSESQQFEDQRAFLFGKSDHVVVDTPIKKNANYKLNLVTRTGNVSPEAQYVSVTLDNHPEEYLPDMSFAEKIQVRNQLEDRGMPTDKDGLNELPDQMLEYAQAVAITEKIDEIDLKDIWIYYHEPNSSRETENTWFDRYGQEMLQKIDSMEKPVADSSIISENLGVSAKQVGVGLTRLQDRYGENLGYSRSSGTKNWHIEKIQEELNLERLAEEGLEAI